MSEISSGLVAFCYMSDQYEVALFSEPPTDPLYDDMFPVVRLSDAEAIIADLNNLVIAENQRKQQLEADVAEKDAEQMQADFGAAIHHAISLGSEAADFLRYWNEGDWDACAEFGFTPSEALRNPHKAMEGK